MPAGGEGSRDEVVVTQEPSVDDDRRPIVVVAAADEHARVDAQVAAGSFGVVVAVDDSDYSHTLLYRIPWRVIDRTLPV